VGRGCDSGPRRNVKPVQKDYKMNTKNIVMAVVAGAALIGAPLAKANSISLIAESGGSSLVGTVNGSADSISFGTVAGWTIGQASGYVPPDVTAPVVMDSGEENIVADGTAPLVIIFSATGYTLSGNTLAGAMETLTGSLLGSPPLQGTLQTYYSTNNVLGATSTLLTTESFNVTATGAIPTQTATGTIVDPSGGPFTLTQVLTINKGLGSFDNALSIPDGGMTLTMLGSGLVALAGIRAKFGRKNG
jgi:hypothetical protein